MGNTVSVNNHNNSKKRHRAPSYEDEQDEENHIQGYSASTSKKKISGTVALGAGSYWGTEKFIRSDFKSMFPKTIKEAHVGFMSPNPSHSLSKKSPTYEHVCAGDTGYVEVLYLELNNPTHELFEALIRFFFQFHDPTTKNRQGNDRGFQYASYIFTSDDAQARIARKVRDELQHLINIRLVSCYSTKVVHTNIVPMKKFFKGPKSHQKYLERNVRGYCNHRLRFRHWPQLLSERVVDQ
mmetsp:Transcript_7356/g.10979  ORF Transcript_7356/g.10979 Transcript_7356/m.10979 type:complete len:239 (-) Transcript_7356:1112-1828(-)